MERFEDKSVIVGSHKTDTVCTIAFCWDGKLATGSYDQTVRLWNIHTGQCLQILKGHYGFSRYFFRRNRSTFTEKNGFTNDYI
ncbi:MAG: hypothetical protein DSM106950_39685 [Stigonema ocellatum SAG 48.90 = DSM 106950]|nr:hypothetical protein [Stigonema ocellatum SAG 48.90 = DSM 106950]